jgi:uncharacterized membrane protein
MNKTIDTQAPLFARKEIFIEAPIEKVWNIQTDIENWHEWQPDIALAELQGDLVPGAVFRWKANGLGIVSTLHTVSPHHEIGWIGVSLGMFAIHNWTFKEQGKGTLVVTEESLSGWFARLLKMFDRNFLEKSLEASLQKLKSRVVNAG